MDTQNLCRHGHPHAVEAIKLRRNNRKVRVSTRFFLPKYSNNQEGLSQKEKSRMRRKPLRLLGFSGGP